MCKTHTNCCGGKPEWGKLHGEYGPDRKLLCCTGGPVDMEQVELSTAEEGVYKSMLWWDTHPLVEPKTLRSPDRFPLSPKKYVTFELDHGGFNNIRLAFEVVVAFALVTGRTLVLPPSSSWYLLDWGPKGATQGANGIRSMEMDGSLSSISDYWDESSLKKILPTMSTFEFIQLERTRLNIPNYPEFASELALKGGTNADMEPWRHWLMENALWMPHLPGTSVLYWPSIDAVQTRFQNQVPPHISSGRRPYEYDSEMKDATIIHFPGGWTWPPDNKLNLHPKPQYIPKHGGEYRYLGYWPGSVIFGSHEQWRGIKQAFRDGVHYRPELFKIAAKVVTRLNRFSYGAMHIRRNELQYHNVKIGAAKIMKNTEALFQDREPLYIASDEVHPEFFDAIRSKHFVYQWKDFYGPTAKFHDLEGLDIPQKYWGMIEQIICANARLFVGTDLSTFTAHIFRLRGYLNAPDKSIYKHTLFYEKPTVPEYWRTPSGSDFYNEWHTLWEHLE